MEEMCEGERCDEIVECEDGCVIEWKGEGVCGVCVCGCGWDLVEVGDGVFVLCVV